MMRKFLSLFAVLAAGWVGATMVPWSGPSIKAPTASTDKALQGEPWITITVTFTAPADVSKATNRGIFSMLGTGDGGNYTSGEMANKPIQQGMALRIKDGEVNAVSQGKGSSGFSPHYMDAAVADKVYTVVFEGRYGTTENDSAEKFDFVYSGEGLKGDTVKRINYVENSKFTLQYDGDLVDNITIVYGEQTFSVPEPTALALLALGLTGLALRRRIA